MKRSKRTKTTEISVEKSEVFVVRKPGRVLFARCPECAARVQLLTPEDAATLAHVSTRTIYRGIEAGRLHFAETPEELPLLCLKSLATLNAE